MFNDYQIKVISKLIEDEFKKALLLKTYPFAPGFNNDAYGKGRDKKYRGTGDKKASGGLFNSIKVDFDKNEGDGSFILYMNDYWTTVDEGRKPGKYVPISPLKKWASLRLGLSDKEATGAAFGISKNIYKFGIAPTYFYEEAVTQTEKILEGPIGDMLGKTIEDILDNLLEKTIGK